MVPTIMIVGSWLSWMRLIKGNGSGRGVLGFLTQVHGIGFLVATPI